jgi:choline dehydrogenase
MNDFSLLTRCTGGTAGLVLADRLTESGTQSVLVLEAGGLPTDVAAYETPGGNQFLGGEFVSISWKEHIAEALFR